MPRKKKSVEQLKRERRERNRLQNEVKCNYSLENEGHDSESFENRIETNSIEKTIQEGKCSESADVKRNSSDNLTDKDSVEKTIQKGKCSESAEMKGNSSENLTETDPVEKTIQKGKCSESADVKGNSSENLTETDSVEKTEKRKCSKTDRSEVISSENLRETVSEGKTNLKETDYVKETEKEKISKTDGSEVNRSGHLIDQDSVGKTNEKGNCLDSNGSEVNNFEFVIETNSEEHSYKNRKFAESDRSQEISSENLTETKSKGKIREKEDCSASDGSERNNYEKLMATGSIRNTFEKGKHFKSMESEINSYENLIERESVAKTKVKEKSSDSDGSKLHSSENENWKKSFKSVVNETLSYRNLTETDIIGVRNERGNSSYESDMTETSSYKNLTETDLKEARNEKGRSSPDCHLSEPTSYNNLTKTDSIRARNERFFSESDKHKKPFCKNMRETEKKSKRGLETSNVKDNQISDQNSFVTRSQEVKEAETVNNQNIVDLTTNQKSRGFKRGLSTSAQAEASCMKKIKYIPDLEGSFIIKEIERQNKWKKNDDRVLQQQKTASIRSKQGKVMKSISNKEEYLKERKGVMSNEEYFKSSKTVHSGKEPTRNKKKLLNKEDYLKDTDRRDIENLRKYLCQNAKTTKKTKNRKRKLETSLKMDEQDSQKQRKIAERTINLRPEIDQTKKEIQKFEDGTLKEVVLTKLNNTERDSVRSEMDDTVKNDLRILSRLKKQKARLQMDDIQRKVTNLHDKERKKKSRSEMDDIQREIRRQADRKRKAVQWSKMNEREQEIVRSQNRHKKQKARLLLNDLQRESIIIHDRQRKKTARLEMDNKEREITSLKDRERKKNALLEMDNMQRQIINLHHRERKMKARSEMGNIQKTIINLQDRKRKKKARSEIDNIRREVMKLQDRERKKKAVAEMDNMQRQIINLQNRERKKKTRSEMDSQHREITRRNERERKAVQWYEMDNTEKDSVRIHNQQKKQKARSQMDYIQRQIINIQDRRRKKKARTDLSDKQKQQQRMADSNRKKQERISACSTKHAAIQTFRNLVKCGPVYICTCCHRLLYRDYVLLYNQSSYSNCERSLLEHSITGYISIDNKEYICKTCNWSLKRGCLPAQAVANNLQLDEIPEELEDLSTLESSLISRRVPFMKILALPRGKQRAIHGCVINVPVNPEETCSILPRLPSSSSVITVKLKRKLCYRGHVIKQNVRPWKVLQALHHLKYTEKNPHYSDVVINEHWDEDSMVDNPELWENMKSSDPQADKSFQLTEDIENEIKTSNACDDENEAENNSQSDNENDENSQLKGLPFDSCLQPKDMSSDKEFMLSIAPGEGKKPIGIYSDKHNEELAFPVLFPTGCFGYDCQRVQKLSMKKYFNARILNADGRFASSTEYLFYAQYRCEAKDVADCLSISLRKCKSKCQQDSITAGQIKNVEEIRKLIRNDLSYHFLQKVRGSPAYFNKLLYDLLGMVRQLGNCTWFLTLSAADLKWAETIQIIAAQCGQILSEDEVNALTWEQKCMWLRSNPVTAARQFDYRLQMFMKTLILGPLQTIGQIQDYKYRIEFQQRGSPHAHMLIWIKDAPQIGESSSEEVAQFVDRYVCCTIPSDQEELAGLVQTLQKHAHSPACRKHGKTCRFAFPRPPVDETTVFLPHEIPVSDATKTIYSDVLTAVQDKLMTVQPETDLSLSDMLEDLQFPDVLYKNALQWIKTKQGRPSVVIKRKPNEGFINNYNPILLQAWQANMDIQFVDHVQACVMYVSSYISKPEKTLGDVLKSVSKTCEPQGPKRMMETVAKKFLSHREVSAQEAVYRLLSLPLIKGSRQVLFVPTDLPDNRTKLFKPLKLIQELDDDDEDLYLSGVIEKYRERPSSLADTCLADFAAYYTYSRSRKNEAEEFSDSDQDQSQEQVDEANGLPKTIRLQTSGTKLTKRARPALIRTHQFSQQKQEEQFYHSKLLLYYPWRVEEAELKDQDGLYKSKYIKVYEELAVKMCEYEPNAEEFRQAFDDLQRNGPPEDAWSALAPQTEQERAEDIVQGPEDDTEYEIIAPASNMQAQDLGIRLCEYEHQTRLVSNAKWLNMILSLNPEQKQVHQFILEWCTKMSMTYKTNQHPSPFYLFLTGGAGVGKSHVVKTIVQTAKRHLNVGQGEDDTTVMVCALTGAAAFNIEGHTLHSAFHLPVHQTKHDDYIRLSNEQLASMRSKLGNLCILIIDEISMVGADQLFMVHNRLAEVMTSDAPFGGVSVLAVGDLFQLPPVGQKPVFEPTSDPLAALYGSLWRKHFKCIELLEIMRQKEDVQFANTLNRFRTSQQTEEDMRLIQARHLDGNIMTYPVEALHIFAYNKDVDEHNNKMLQLLNMPIVTISAIDSKRDEQTGRVDIISLGEKASGMLQEVKLAVGARVMMTKNVDVVDGLVNSAAGTVTGFLPPPPTAGNQEFLVYTPKYVLVQFDDSRVGESVKAKLRKILPDTVSTPVSRAEVLVKQRKITAKRTQFPLALAWGITIHKAQGRTVEQLVVSTAGSFRAGQMYAALSRVKSLNGLYILGEFSDKKVKADLRSKQEMQRLMENSEFNVDFPGTVKVSSSLYFKLSLININSLKPHHTCLSADTYVTDSSIIVLTETWLKQTDNSDDIMISEDYALIRKDHRSPRGTPNGGIALHIHKDFLMIRELDHRVPYLQYLCVLLGDRNDPKRRLLLVAIYNPPGVPAATFLKQLDSLLSHIPCDSVPTILSGDFNIDILKQSKQSEDLQRVMFYYGFHQFVMSPTHKKGSGLDHVYINRDLRESLLVSSMPVPYSDHFHVLVAVPYTNLLADRNFL